MNLDSKGGVRAAQILAIIVVVLALAGLVDLVYHVVKAIAG